MHPTHGSGFDTPAASPPVALALITAAVAVLAGGAIHLHDWITTYRYLPSSVPGAAVVQIGFPVNAVVSVLAAAAVSVCAYRAIRVAPLVIVGTLVFQAASLASLIASRTGTVFGWSEMTWTSAANRTRAVEIVAMLALSFAGASLAAERWLVTPRFQE